MQKLLITRCTVSGGEVKSTDDNFEAQINPASFSHGHSVSYAGVGSGQESSSKNDTPLGQTAAESRFSKIDDETVNFDLVLDGTGVVRKADGNVPDVRTEIETLKNIAYRYVGDMHEPSVVRLNWGGSDGFSFDGRLTSMSIDYTLFRPSGLPLRAKVSLKFVSYMTRHEASLRAERSSPDLTHEVQVRDGDTLPLLCQRIYNDPSHYLLVARTNGLVNFRQLAAGSWLHFPPLDK